MKLGLLHKPYTFRLQHYAVVAPVVFFQIKPVDALGLSQSNSASAATSSTAPSPVLIENAQWPLIQKALGADIFDMVMPKPRAEMLLAGTAWNPNRHAQTPQNNSENNAFQVGMQLGNQQKVLNILGDRHWKKGLLSYSATAPAPVESVQLNDENSYGGASHSINPLGKGHYPSRADRKTQQENGELWLPNIEEPQQPTRSMKQTNVPAGFSSIAITHPQRDQHNGDYTNKEWLEKHYPALAPDTDMRLFQAAREDQQFAQYLRGDETFALANLHPDAALISGTLPCVRPRVLVNFTGSEQLTEVSLNLDTVWFFPGEEIGALVYHGQIPVNDVDAADIANLMLAYENLNAPPRPLEHYQTALNERLDPETAPLVMADDSPLVPEKTDADMAEIEQEKAAEQAELAAKQQAQQQALLEEIQAEHGGQLPPDFAIPEPEPASDEMSVSQSDIDRGEINLKALKQAADKAQADAEQQKQEVQSEHDQQIKKAAELQDNVDPALKKEMNAKASLDEQITPAIAAINSNNDTKDALDPEQQATIEEMQRRASRYHTTPFTDWPEDPLAQEKRALFLAAWQNGEDLSKRDWTGCDLSNLDLTGVNLSQCQLENCNFEHTIFNQANLEKTGFVGAKFKHTQFNKAQLAGSNFSSTIGEYCQFQQADMPKVQFFKAELRHCQWQQANLQQSQFMEATLPRANFTGCQLTQCNFVQCQLFDSDFSGVSARMMSLMQCELSYSRWQQAMLSRCAFLENVMPVSNLTDVKFERCQFSVKLNLDGANLTDAQLYQCGFRRISMNRAIAQNSYFIECDLGDSDLQFGRFSGAQFKRSVLSDSRCQHSIFEHSGLYQALLRKTDLQASQLDQANFLEADCTLAITANSNYRDAINVPDIALRRWRDAERTAA